LCRYTKEVEGYEDLYMDAAETCWAVVGLCTLNQVDP
jgi:hypothetical protein